MLQTLIEITLDGLIPNYDCIVGDKLYMCYYRMFHHAFVNVLNVFKIYLVYKCIHCCECR